MWKLTIEQSYNTVELSFEDAKSAAEFMEEVTAHCNTKTRFKLECVVLNDEESEDE